MPGLNQPSLFDQRQKRRYWLEKLIIPTLVRDSDGRSVRSNSIKHLLRSIESFCGNKMDCHPSVTTLAAQMNVSTRTVTRNIADAIQLGFLTVTRTSGGLSSYSLNWSNIAQAILDHPLTTGLIDPHAAGLQVAQATQDSTTDTPDKLTRTPDKLSPTPDKLTGTPDKLSPQAAAHTSITRVRLNHDLTHVEPMFKTSWGHKTKTNTGGWPFEIKPDQLISASSVQMLFEHALERGWVRRENRLAFFTLAIWTHSQKRKGAIKNAGAVFTSAVRKSAASGLWPGTNSQEQAAQAAIKKLDQPKRG